MPKTSTRSYTKCRGCGKLILRSNFKYCRDCSKIEIRMENEEISFKGRKTFWVYLRKHGRRCCLSGVSLEIDDDTSPWYLVFSRPNPRNKNRIVPASALFNGLKSALTKRMFQYYVLALDDHRKKHLKVKKRPVVHWRPALLADKGVCPGCGGPARKGHKFCARCSKINFRMHHEHFSPESMNSVWDYLHTYGFIDHYTGMKLDLDNPKSPWYLVFDHWMPRDPRKIVITSALINEMKGDLTEDEFWYFIHQLANHFRYGTPVRKIKLRFWSRPYRAPQQIRSLKVSLDIDA